jgi:hypothetical protein
VYLFKGNKNIKEKLLHVGSLMARQQALHFVRKPLLYLYIPAAIYNCCFFFLQVKNKPHNKVANCALLLK